jgi:Lrp/AsnC family leucine-responsive transcriptional regulator
MNFRKQVIEQLDNRSIKARDRRLLYELELDARARLPKLAAALKISEEAVRQKIAKLEKTGAIGGYQSIINLPKIGVESFRVYAVLSCSKDEREEFWKHLKESSKTWWIAEINGEWNFEFVVWARGNWEFWRFWKEFYGKFGGIIKKYRINSYTELTFLPRTFLVADERRGKNLARAYEGTGRVGLDETEKRVLSAIAFHARDSVVEISKRAQLHYATVARTIGRLEKQGVILGYRALIDRNGLGLEYYKVDVGVSSTEKVEAVKNYALSNPFVIYIDNVIGGSSFEFDFLALNSDHAKEILDEVRAVCGVKLNHLEFFQAMTELKLAHFPIEAVES